jgi:plasmid maintenance system killer protein
MKVSYARKKDALIETDQAHSTGLPATVIASARTKIQYIKNAKDERDLRMWASLQFKRLKGNSGECQIRINDQYRIHLTIDENNEVEITFIGDPH